MISQVDFSEPCSECGERGTWPYDPRGSEPPRRFHARTCATGIREHNARVRAIPRRKLLAVVFEPRDLWLGVYVSPTKVFVVVVPCFPIVWTRRRKMLR